MQAVLENIHRDAAPNDRLSTALLVVTDGTVTGRASLQTADEVAPPPKKKSWWQRWFGGSGEA